MLGADNTSSVTLENFNPLRTFPLATTYGKLANIVAEMGEITKAAEGLLKDFISGGEILVERKFKEPFPMVPTARLTYATNTLPHFKDRSDGIWRRLLRVPFRVQILDESKQDKTLIRTQTWLPELPGILNWALVGLARLKLNNSFTKCELVNKATEQYKLDSNSHLSFLKDHVEIGGQVSCKQLFETYSQWMDGRRAATLTVQNFTQEVRRHFKEARRTKNVVRLRKGRDKVWVGISLPDNETDIPEGKDYSNVEFEE
jgi:putative DNA primase/helicase